MSLIERCDEFLSGLVPSGAGSAWALSDFVRSEIGRAADATFEESSPLVLYFASESDRSEFLQAVRDAKPGMISRAWPA